MEKIAILPTHIVMPTMYYTLINSAAIAVGFHLWWHFTTPAYQIVTLFITLIVVSNCLAKLYVIYIHL